MYNRPTKSTHVGGKTTRPPFDMKKGVPQGDTRKGGCTKFSIYDSTTFFAHKGKP